MRQWCRIGLLCGILFLVACSGTTFLYNRLDFLLPWYVEDYADLDAQQETYLADLLAPFLRWHRNQELPRYAEILEGIQGSLDRPQTAASVAAVFAQMEAAWLRLEGETLDWLLDLGAQLSDEQIDGFMNVLWQQQQEFDEKYLERTEEEFYQDSYESMVDSAKEYLGPLSDDQRALLRAASRSLLRSDKAWLAERAAWFVQLGELLKRQPQWQQRLKDAVAQRREHPSAEYAKVYAHNMNVIYEAVAQLLNSRSERQDWHLRDRLADLHDDLEVLIAQGKDSSASPAD